MKRFLILAIGLVMVVALVMTSCQGGSNNQANQGQTVQAQVTQPTQTLQTTTAITSGQTTAPVPAGPKYGGTFSYAMGQDILGFDEVLGQNPWYLGTHLTNEELLQGDWKNGPAGTGRFAFSINAVSGVDMWTGCVAESWELKDTNTLIFHIRQGIRWANKTPVNGRELNADDVVFSLKRNFETSTAYLYKTYTASQRPTSIKALDKWTVVVQCQEGMAGEMLEAGGDICRIVAPEVINATGPVKDWRNVIGTGPFSLVDYVPESSLRYAKNPDYWGTDPLNPNNKLPYVDFVNVLVIPDSSTYLAALRTGKSDMGQGIGWENRDDLRKTAPELNEVRRVTDSPQLIFMRTDKAPFNDIRVRRALAMGLNRQSISDTLYNKQAVLNDYPVVALPDFKDAYTEIDQLPPDAKELFKYNPDQAKKLLTEAGFPTGLKISVVLYNTAALMDVFAVVKDDWAKIGVELTLDVRDYAVWTSLTNSHNYDQMITRYMSSSIPFKMYAIRPGTTQNMSMINDPFVNEMYPKVAAAYFDPAEANRLMKQVAEYVLQQAWMIQLPASLPYVMWWPWVHNFEGATLIGRNNHWVFPKYLWLDQAQKSKIVGK